MEENNYYPYGLKHASYASSVSLSFQKQLDDWGVILAPVTNNPYKYKYNGKELQDELSLNMYSMDMRQYDPAIARWVVLDPVIHHSMSPYNAFDNNPVFWADPSGADGENSDTSTDSGGYDVQLAFGVMASDLQRVGAVDSYYYGDGYQTNSSSKKNNSAGNNNNDRPKGNVSGEWTPEMDALFDGDPINHNPDAQLLPVVNATSKSSLEAGLEVRANEALEIWSNWGSSNNFFNAINGFAFGNSIKTQMIDYTVRGKFSDKEFKALNEFGQNRKLLETFGAKGGIKYLKYAKNLGTISEVVNVGYSGYQFYENPTAGNATRLAVQGIAIGTAFIPGVGWAISLGIGTADAIWGDDFYNWIDDH